MTIPIPGDPIPPGTPEYVGSPATPQPVTAPAPPQHPFLAPDPGNNIHNDAYMTDSCPGPGPLGVNPKVTSTMRVVECASLTFDRRGRLETGCVGAIRPTLKLFDPTSLNQIASYNLPPRPLVLNLFTDFSGGGYFYLDQLDRAVIPTGNRHIQVVGQNTAGNGFVREHDYDLTGSMAGNDKIVSALPAWSGEIVFVTEQGVVGAVDPETGSTEVPRSARRSPTPSPSTRPVASTSSPPRRCIASISPTRQRRRCGGARSTRTPASPGRARRHPGRAPRPRW